MNYKKTATRLRNGNFEYRGYEITRMPANEWLILDADNLPRVPYEVRDGVEHCPNRLSEAKQLIDAALEA